MKSIRVLIGTEFSLIREGLKSILHSNFDQIAIGEAAAAWDLLELLRTQHWDILLLDTQLCEEKGIELLTEMRKGKPQLAIIMMTFQSGYPFALQAIKAGVMGYLTKDVITKELPAAVRKVTSGSKYVNTSIAEKLIATLSNDGSNELHEQLSTRELAIMRMLSQGKRQKLIAHELNLSIKTISTYRGRALRKLNMQSNAEFINYALKHNLLS